MCQGGRYIKKIMTIVCNLIKAILGKKKTSIEDIYINEEEEIAFANVVDAWEREVWPLEKAKEQEIEKKELEAYFNDRNRE